MLVLIAAMLANVVVIVAGRHVRHSGQQRRYQSNSIRHRNVLSVWRLGLEWLRRHRASAAPPGPSGKRFKYAFRRSITWPLSAPIVEALNRHSPQGSVYPLCARYLSYAEYEYRQHAVVEKTILIHFVPKSRLNEIGEDRRMGLG